MPAIPLKICSSLKAFILVLVFLCLTFLFYGCAHKPENKPFRIGFSQCVGSDLWRRTMLSEMKMELSLHPGNEFIYADANNNSERQVRQVREMLSKGIDLLIISPNEARPLTAIVEEVYAMGIPVVVIDRKTSSSLYTAYVGAENHQVGEIAGDYLTNVLGGKGRVIEIMGLPGSSPAIERDRGFVEALKDHPGMELTAQLYGDWLPENTESALLNSRAKLKGINAVFAHNDRMAERAKVVLEQLKLDSGVRVLGVDALPGRTGGLDLVSSKKLTASVLYPTGGKEAISIAMKILSRQPFQKQNILQTVVIDSSNVQLMKLQWERINNQQHDIERQQVLLADQLKVYNNQRTVLNFIVISLVLAVVFGGLAFQALLQNRKITRSLEQKNAEILSQRNQLVKMSEKAEAATEAKLNFFTNISHEFRTPLTLILSPLEDLLKNTRLLQSSKKELDLIHRNVYRLLRMVNQLMDYRKIEHQEFKLHASPNSLIDFVREIMDSFQHSAAKRNIELKLVISDDPGIVWFDVHMLDKVIFNLLSNALKFTGDHGRISVRIGKDQQHAWLEVSDTGLGMNVREQQKIFEPFYQSESNYSRGSGLGLSLSRALILLHRGNISVSSEEGRGTTFIVTLPLGEDHLTEVEKKPQQKPGAGLYDEMKIYTTALDHGQGEKAEAGTDLIKSQSILIVEDHAELLEYLVSKFEPFYEVFAAESGTAGLALAYEKVPDLIISDVVIPGMSGRTLAGQLKSDLRTSHIPLILLTAQGSIEQQVAGLQSSADVYITKPFNLEYLQANVENLIRNRAMLREHYISDISASGIKKAAVNSIDKKFLNDFAGFVEKNLGNEHFSVEEISREIGISRVQLYRKVKALLNCSISDYIMSRRLKKAKYYLLHEEYTITEIAYKVGISSATYFSTIFKNKYGQTPSEFKKRTGQPLPGS